MVKQGKKIWIFITADYVFGHSLEEQNSGGGEVEGGEVKGAVRYPFPDTTDFSAFLTQAMASGATGAGPGQCRPGHAELRQAGARVRPEQADEDRAAAACSSGRARARPRTAPGLVTTETFYWDMNDRTRAFTKRVLPRTPNNYPNQAHASAYGITLHYLKAVGGDGGGDGEEERAQRRSRA